MTGGPPARDARTDPARDARTDPARDARTDPARQAQVAQALAEVRARIDRACAAAGRSPAGVRLLPVTKTFPADDVLVLHALGERDFGENKAQEAAAKAVAVAQAGAEGARWHMLGRVQRNKAAAVARWAAAVHSVDSVRLVQALDRAAASEISTGARKGLLRIMIQVSLDGDPARGGAPVGDVGPIAEAASAASALELSGLMAVPPLSADPEGAFAQLAHYRERFVRSYPHARELSAGMSGDLELAVRYGSTCVRVGTALLGRRPITSP